MLIFFFLNIGTFFCLLPFVSHLAFSRSGFPSGQTVKSHLQSRRPWVSSPGQEDPLEKGMATHSSTLAWRISWTEEPGVLQFMGSESDTTEQLALTYLTFSRYSIDTSSKYSASVCSSVSNSL